MTASFFPLHLPPVNIFLGPALQLKQTHGRTDRQKYALIQLNEQFYTLHLKRL